MKKQILHKLQQIEQEEQVQIIYACESGSRAWGFESQNSDYDVRFIYVRPLDHYLTIFEQRDVIERPLDNDLDVNGWDIRKALQLLRKSNPPLLEWLHSPIQYLNREHLTIPLYNLVSDLFSAKSSIFHYLHMAKGNYRAYLKGEQVKLKKYFYVLRPILACGWIEKYGKMPPVQFQTLVDKLIPQEHEIFNSIQSLLEQKRSGDELHYGKQIPALNLYLEERINYFEQFATNMSSQGSQQAQTKYLKEKNDSTKRLDEVFKAIVYNQ